MKTHLVLASRINLITQKQFRITILIYVCKKVECLPVSKEDVAERKGHGVFTRDVGLE